MTSAVDATSGRFSLGKDLDVPLWRVRRGMETYSATLRTPHETEVAGVPVGRHEKVLLLIASANRDETRRERADQLDIARRLSGHMGFGIGIHDCMGQDCTARG